MCLVVHLPILPILLFLYLTLVKHFSLVSWDEVTKKGRSQKEEELITNSKQSQEGEDSSLTLWFLGDFCMKEHDHGFNLDCFWLGKHETLRGYAAQISKNQVKYGGKWFLEAKEPKLHKVINLPVLGFLEADDLCEIFNQSNKVQKLWKFSEIN